MKKKDNISKTDKEVWENYTKNPNNIFDKENIDSDPISNKRYKFDLHGYTLDNANTKVRELIFFCLNKKYKEILLITGKGIHSDSDSDIYASKNLSKLRHSIPDYIKNNSDLSDKIISLSAALPNEGGDGAILIKLKIL